MLRKLIYFSTIFTLILKIINAEVFTAIDDFEQFLLIENEMIGMLKMQINDYESKLKILKHQHDEYLSKHNEAIRDIQSYLANPINPFLLTKRITIDWEYLKNETVPMRLDEDEILSSITFNNNPIERPTHEDLFGIAMALVRLQETYNLQPKYLARGIVSNHQYNISMTASDCYELGILHSKGKEYASAIAWFNESLNNSEDNSLRNVGKEHILSEIAYAYYANDQFKEALNVTKSVLEILPLDETANNNKIMIEETIRTNELKHSKMKTRKTAIPEETSEKNIEERMILYNDNQFDLYQKLCRKELVPTPAQEAPLRCKYITNDVAFLKIGPIKMEEASLNPLIVKFHNFLYEPEIKYIKSKSRPYLSRALVEDYRDNVSIGEATDYRISKSAWIHGNRHAYIRAINQRIQDLTKTSLKSAESLQVVNYGIGGQYEPHFDFALKDDLTFELTGDGNRIATFMFYMSNVAEGGATVFPLINVAVWPEKGSAVFWWNLFASGSLDYRTKHAGCPVLVGSKWVSNKWIHEKGQEFLRPCQLTPDDNYLNVYL